MHTQEEKVKAVRRRLCVANGQAAGKGAKKRQSQDLNFKILTLREHPIFPSKL